METNKRLVLILPADVFRKLEEQARTEDRDATQQARVIIKRAVVGESQPSGVAS